MEASAQGIKTQTGPPKSPKISPRIAAAIAIFIALIITKGEKRERREGPLGWICHPTSLFGSVLPGWEPESLDISLGVINHRIHNIGSWIPEKYISHLTCRRIGSVRSRRMRSIANGVNHVAGIVYIPEPTDVVALQNAVWLRPLKLNKLPISVKLIRILGSHDRGLGRKRCRIDDRC